MIGWSVSYRQSVERDIQTKQREQLSVIAEYVVLASPHFSQHPPVAGRSFRYHAVMRRVRNSSIELGELPTWLSRRSV
jgi:hypothetical protein